MVVSWLKWLADLFEPKKKQVRDFVTPFPQSWQPFLEALPFYALLKADQQARLQHILRVLVWEKRWEGCGGFEITDEVKVTIAAQAAQLLLNLEHDYYRGVETILVYPSAFVVEREGGGRDVNLGEAWHGGPVVLAWDAAYDGAANRHDGRNLVLHEFAHKLDLLDDFANGTPPLGTKQAYTAWQRIMTDEYRELVERRDASRRTLLDPYGATNPAEFFAVATECFFEKSWQLRQKHPALYRLLRDYYGQDPGDRG